MTPLRTFARLLLGGSLIATGAGTAFAMQPQPAHPGEAPAILAAASAIIVPDTVDSGAEVSVAIPGAAAGTTLELWGPVTQTGKGALILSQPLSGAQATVPMTGPAGSYELRHVGSDGTILARTPIDISAAPLVITAPSDVGPSGDVQVRWQGPADAGDRIAIFDPVGSAIITEVAAEGTPYSEHVSVLTAPVKNGRYEIRYLTAAGDVLRVAPLEVTAGNDWLRSPIEVSVGERFAVQWYGKAEPGTIFQVVDDAGITHSTAEVPVVATGSADAELIAPAKAGRYQVQVFQPSTAKVLTSLPLDVDPAS